MQRRQYSENLENQAVELSLYCGQAWSDVVAMRLSDLSGFFATKAFAGWKKARDHEAKLQLAIIDRLDGVIKSIHGLAKSRR